jgi:hypothetical protein
MLQKPKVKLPVVKFTLCKGILNLRPGSQS